MLKFSLSIFAMLATWLSATGVGLAGTGDWNIGNGYKIRLIHNGLDKDGASALVGVHLKLEDGWKTYWRAPGESGIAPSFSFEKSLNVAAVQLHWPKPKVFWQPSDNTIGYKGEFVVPVRVNLKKNKGFTVVNLKAFFGVCREICVPADQELSVMIPPISFEDGESAALLEKAVASIPRTIEKATPKIEALAFDDTHVHVTLPPAKTDEKTTVIIEGGTQWFFDPVIVETSTEKSQTALVPYSRFDGKTDLPKNPLRITVLSPTSAWEEWVETSR